MKKNQAIEDGLREISFGTAVIAKSIGFNVQCYSWYNEGDTHKKLYTGSLHNHNHPRDTVTISAPAQSVLREWLRINYSLWIEITGVSDVGLKVIVRKLIGNTFHVTTLGIERHYDYPAALEKGLLYACSAILSHTTNPYT